jgi:hypothetical protein
MNSPESIEELARLLTEEKRLDEKLQETQEILSTVKKKVSESRCRKNSPSNAYSRPFMK